MNDPWDFKPWFAHRPMLDNPESLERMLEMFRASAALEKAHIIAWCDSKNHSAANLICLCANCHTRYDNEKWEES